jgi:WhiA LAGLIDADG-like domain/WhiA C-terminal HTH domain
VSDADRDLVAAIRSEVAAVAPQRACDRAAESAGLGAALATREASVARLAVRLGRGPTEAGRLLVGRRRTKSVRMDGAAADALPFDWASAAEHCRTAWLRGRFLARGSLSLASGRAHLEFVVDRSEAPTLTVRLAEFGLPASWRVRRGRGVVTSKSTEAISTFLRRIGAGSAILELESRQVARALRGDLNRVVNAESANLQRAVVAAARQLAAIGRLEADGRLARQPYVVRVVAAARRETPEATFGELATRLELHRSAVQRALERLERLALRDDDETGSDGVRSAFGRSGVASRRPGGSARRPTGPSSAAGRTDRDGRMDPAGRPPGPVGEGRGSGIMPS